MAYPYIPSGGLIQTAFQQFRKSLPSKVDSETLKKLGIASSNEGALINIMKFINILDQDNQKTKEGTQLFTTHEDGKFAENLSKLVRHSYSGLFELHAEGAWTLDRDALISYFRGSDETSAVTGARQALTFQTLASLAGKRPDQITSRTSQGPRTANKEKSSKDKKPNIKATPTQSVSAVEFSKNGHGPVGLTVRIEINLPANGSQATYDNIFESIRKNLLSGNV